MTATELVDVLDASAPGFAAYFQSDENLFDGGTKCAAFLALCSFVREQPISVEAWARLAEIANQSVGGTDAELDEAVCTCFLENLADPAHPLKPLLRGEALAYWNKWEPTV